MEDLAEKLEECKAELKRLEAAAAAGQLLQQVDEKKAAKKSLLMNIRGKGSPACLLAAEDSTLLARYRSTSESLRAIAEEAMGRPTATKGREKTEMHLKLEERERLVEESVEKVTGHISALTQVLLSIPLSDKHRMEVQTVLGHIIRDLQPLQSEGSRKRSSSRNAATGERPSERLKQKIAEKKRKRQAKLANNVLKFEATAEDAGTHMLSTRDRSRTLASMPRPSLEAMGILGEEKEPEGSDRGQGGVKRHLLRKWKSELLLDSWDAPAFLMEVVNGGEHSAEEAGETVVQEDAEELKAILRRQRTIRKTLAVPSVAPFAPQEQRDVSKRLTFVLTDDGQQLLVGGEIEDIWLWVVAKSGNEKDLCTLLLLFRSYTTAAVLVEVLERFLDNDSSEVNEIALKRIQFGLSVWIKLFIDDFIKDQQAGNALIALIDKLEALLYPDNPTLEMDGRSLKNVMRDNITAALAERSSQTLREPVVLSPRSRYDKREFLQFPSRDVARQLCLVEFEKFSRVVASDTISSKDRAASPSINSLVGHFNRMSGWVSTEIVMNPNVKKRAAIVRGFINVALACLQLRNYNAVLEIVAGLNQSIVQRLKKTWKLVPRKQMASLKELELLMDPQGNYKAYRETIKSTKLPAVPYVGIYLKDATFIDEGNKDFLESGAANFEKMRMKAALISSIEFFQLRGYTFCSDNEIHNYLQNVTVMDEKTAYKHSLQCEPRTMDM